MLKRNIIAAPLAAIVLVRKAIESAVRYGQGNALNFKRKGKLGEEIGNDTKRVDVKAIPGVLGVPAAQERSQRPLSVLRRTGMTRPLLIGAVRITASSRVDLLEALRSLTQRKRAYRRLRHTLSLSNRSQSPAISTCIGSAYAELVALVQKSDELFSGRRAYVFVDYGLGTIPILGAESLHVLLLWAPRYLRPVEAME